MQTAPNPLNILIIDNIEAMRKGMEVMLDELKLVKEKFCTPTGTEAVKFAPFFKTQCVIVNYTLSDMPAPECIKQLKKVAPAAAIVAVIPDLKPAQINELVKCGCLGFLPIAFTARQLCNALLNAYNGIQYFTEEVANKMLAHAQKKLAKANSAPGFNLTNRQKEILTEIYEGKKNKEMAAKFKITEKAVEGIKHVLFVKFKVNNIIDLIKEALRKGIIVDEQI